MFGVHAVRLDKRLDLVVTLREWTPEVVEERTGLEENFHEILGLQVPHFELFVRPGRDMARLVEVAAMVQALRRMGHDPAHTFNERLIAHMAAQTPREPERIIRPVTRTPFSPPPNWEAPTTS
jgi:HPr kinase/phosphorylase